MVYIANINTMVTSILWIVHLTLGHCPNDLLREVFTCLHNLTYGDGDGTIIRADADRMQRHCEHGDLRDSVQCLEKIYSQCTSPMELERLRKYADPGAWKSGFTRFCSDTDFYVAQRTCVATLDKQLEQCINRHHESPVQPSDKSAVYVVDQTQGPEQALDPDIQRICRFFYWTNHCLNSELGATCGKRISAILSDFAGGIMPPMCRAFALDNSATRTELSSLGFSITFLFLLLFHKLILLLV